MTRRKPRIEVYVDGRLVLTTEQARAHRGGHPGGTTVNAFRVWAYRNQVKPVAHLDPRTPLWNPDDLNPET
jgi:hypothetical protein